MRQTIDAVKFNKNPSVSHYFGAKRAGVFLLLTFAPQPM
jgi:hypothetical protein